MELTKEERLRKWVSENPGHPIVASLVRSVKASEVRMFIEEKRNEGRTYEEIGKMLGLTKQRIHQIKTKI